MLKRLWLIGVLVMGVAIAAAQDEAVLVVATWNVESGEADPDIIAEQMTAYVDVDLWGLTEVENDDDAELFELAAEVAREAEFERILSVSGNQDRLLILYNADRFELIDTDELDYMNPDNRVRSPLVALLQDRNSGQEFAFMVNHLKSRNDPDSRELRYFQAQELNQWAADAAEFDLPVIAVGDYNFYYEVDGSRYDDGLDYMEADDVFEWVQPLEILNTQCDAQGSGCRFNSVVDFIFVAGAAQQWDGISEIIVTEGDFPDDESTSDHRPVIAEFLLPSQDT